MTFSEWKTKFKRFHFTHFLVLKVTSFILICICRIFVWGKSFNNHFGLAVEQSSSSSFVWASSLIHCLAALDFRAGVEQPFGCLIVQNRQVMKSMGRSMDWTLEDNVVDGLFFCATLTGHRGGHIPFVKTGAETSDIGMEAVKPDPGSYWEGHSGGVGTGVWN